MQNHNNNPMTTISRGLLPIYYSTTSGMSKQLSYKFQTKVQQIGFIAPIMNIGDIQTDQFLQYQGTIVMFLSTYGNGDSPQDGQSFLKWIQTLQSHHILNKISFIILALGNSTFQHFCGHGRRITQALLSHGAQMLLQTKKCDANIQSQNAHNIFDKWWCDKALNILTQKYSLRSIQIDKLTTGLTVQISHKDINWQEQYQKIQTNLSKQFVNFGKSKKTQIINIKQLRNDVNESGRSSLCITIKKPEGFNIWPACNINIYPLNIKTISQNHDHKVIQFKAKKINSKIPFPPMKISQLKSLVNLRQKASNKIIQNAILLSKQSQEIKQKYRRIIKQRKSQTIICQEILNQLKPNFQFYADLGVNLARSYTLASWSENNQSFDICVSLVKNGLASLYFQSMPKHIRINSYLSTFTIPDKQPLIMIANGSGIAPFRSIAQYFANLQPNKRIPLKLYFGIQSQQIDYYFKQDFKKFQKQGILQIKIAQSRKDPNKKVYVQQLVQNDKQFFQQHLFRKNGKIFLCGGKQMAKCVNNAIFKAIVLQCKIAYKGFTILNNFKSQKVIVQQVFG